MIAYSYEWDEACKAYAAGYREKAVALFQVIVRQEPSNFSALYNVGLIFAELGQLENAEKYLANALQLNPKDPDVLDTHGNVLASLGKVEQAISNFEKATHLSPGFIRAYLNKGAILHRAGRFAEAVETYDHALSYQPNDAVCIGNRALSLQAMGHADLALSGFDLAIQLAPADPVNFNNRANLLVSLSRFEEAITDFERALRMDPLNAVAMTGKGEALGKIGKFEEALEVLDLVLRTGSNHTDAHWNRGNILRDQRKLHEAIESYDRALSIQPNFTLARQSKGFALLLSGDLNNGLPLYELRKRLPKPVDLRTYGPPLWTGTEPLSGKTIFVYIEQGLGDTIQFYRFVRPLLGQGAKVILSAQDSLIRLLANAEPRVDVIGSTEVPTAFDFHIPLASIPLALKMSIRSIPAEVPYLTVDPQLKRIWQERLGTEGFKIAIAWQSGATGDHARSFPLRMFEHIGALPGVRLISLQKGLGTSQLEAMPQGMTVECFDKLDDSPDAFIETAAIMANVDLVVTPDTSLAHLAGALAQPVYVMLKEVPDWRWFLQRDDSPWYPTMRLFRQKSFDDWDSAFSLLYSSLKKALSNKN